eukprot:10462828-Lingulodinium_polyedra.AAC.1
MARPCRKREHPHPRRNITAMRNERRRYGNPPPRRKNTARRRRAQAARRRRAHATDVNARKDNAN